MNGKKCDIAYRLNIGDEVSFYISDEFFPDGKTEHIDILKRTAPKITVIYEDANILLADKKTGVKVHPDVKDEHNTLIDHILAYLYQKGEYDPGCENSFTPALCNRIDRNTGGIVICAKNSAALKIINDKLKNNEIKKLYYCIVHGIPEKKSGTLTAYLRKNEKTNIVTIFGKKVSGTKKIVTKYKVIKEKSDKALSLLKIELITGRTHQIRAHFAFIGHPLLGDGKYGRNKEDKKNGHRFQALYSYYIGFEFKSDSGTLNYLNGRKFEIRDIDFVNGF